MRVLNLGSTFENFTYEKTWLFKTLYYINGFSCDGTTILVVDPEFLRHNQKFLRSIQRVYGAEVVPVDVRERHKVPANFLALPDGKVLFAADTPRTQRRLETVIGAGKILTTRGPVNDLLQNGYGIRCFTNVVTV